MTVLLEFQGNSRLSCYGTMNLWLRFAWILIQSYLRKPVSPFQESIVHFHVLPNDLDVNLHMNNGRYFTLMDLGRIDYMMRVGLMKKFFAHKWHALVAGETLQFRRAMKVFQKYELKTRIVGWDDKWFFIEQRFISRHKVIALGYVKALIRGNKRNLSPQEIVRELGFEVTSPTLPDAVNDWQKAESQMIRNHVIAHPDELEPRL